MGSPCESTAEQPIHMKCQVLISLTNNKREIYIASNKALFFQQSTDIFFLFLYENISCGTH